MIYFDNAATTKISPEVYDAMLPYLCELYGNPNSLHHIGRSAAAAVAKAREQVSFVFDCKPDNIIFTSGGSESNNLAIKGMRKYLIAHRKRHIITSAIEHDSVRKTVASLAEEGFEVTYIRPTSAGIIVPELIEREIREDTGLVAIMFVNNETDAVNDVFEIGKICDKHKIHFHADCVQALGNRNLKAVFGMGAISSHKIHGPKGVGALYVKDRSLLTSLICGGDSQEFGLRGGTENVAGVVGFGKACELLLQNMKQDVITTSTRKQEFVSALTNALGSLDSAGIQVNGSSPITSGKILNLRIDGVSSETLVLMLDTLGICVSAGSACRAHESEPSHVLTAMGLTDSEARSSIRISFSKYNTENEVVLAAEALAHSIKILRQQGEQYER